MAKSHDNFKGKIGNDKQVYIIAEMSGNHAGKIERAFEIINAAKDSGADCVKIQTYTPDTLTIDCDEKWFKIDSGTWKGEKLYDLYKKAYTPWEWQLRLKQEAQRIGIDFLSTAYDKSSVDFLEELGIDFYKIASFEFSDIPFIKYIASKGKPMLLSTGLASIGEIEETVNVIRDTGNEDFYLLKCSSNYPAIPEDMNLLTIQDMKKRFNVPIGLSDHSLGSISAVTAVALGAQIIEKHFCLSREIENPDSSFSMEPHEFKQMVNDIRNVEKALGNISYEVSENEEKNRAFKRSIFAVEEIKKGEFLNFDNIRVIRPSYGLAPKYFDKVIGKRAVRDIKRGTPIEWEILE